MPMRNLLAGAAALLLAGTAAAQIHDPAMTGGGPPVSPIPVIPAIDPATGPLPPQAGEALPDAAIQRAVLETSYRYLAARDGGRVDEAYAMIAPSMRAYLTKDLFRSQILPFNREAGAVQQRTITKISWYRDPPDAPAPGLYAAADFISRFPNLYLHCGYLMWHQEPGGAWKLAREEQSFLDTSMAGDMPPERREPLVRQMGCVLPGEAE